MVKNKIWVKKNLGQKKFWVLENFGLKKYGSEKKIWSKNNLGHRKIFEPKNYCGAVKWLCSMKDLEPISLKKISGPKQFSFQRNVRSAKHLGLKVRSKLNKNHYK